MKTLNIFAFLFFVTFVKTTKKIVSYDDIVQSFVLIKQEVNEVTSAKIFEISESFNESNKGLEAFKLQVDATCTNIEQSYNSYEENNKKKLKTLGENLEDLNKQSVAIQDDIDTNIKNQKEEAVKIQEAKDEINKAKDELSAKEVEVVETIQILKRLRNLAQDELAGSTKLDTKMKDLNIVNKHGVSFIQKSLKQELKTVLGRSHTAEKSLISSLILLASSDDDGHYADPAKIQKILDVLDRIVKSNEERKDNLQNDFLSQTNSHNKIISVSEDLLENLKASAIKNQQQLEVNNRTKLMYERDVTQLTRDGESREKRFTFQKEICDKRREMAKNNLIRNQKTVERVNEIKNQFE
jgi:hypothetical protein